MYPWSLITDAEARLSRGMPAAPESADLIAALIGAASQAIEGYCNNVFIRQTVVENVMWDRMAGRMRFALRKYPVQAVLSIEDQAGHSMLPTRYWLDPDNGFVVTIGGWPIPVNANGFPTYWTVKYCAGRFVDTDSVDPVVKQACRLVVEDMFFGGAGDSVKRTIGDFTIEYNRSFTALGGTGQNQIALPELAQTMLASYVSRMI